MSAIAPPVPPTLSLNTTTAFLAGVAAVQFLAASRPDASREAARSNAVGTAVCVIAFLHYAWMRHADAAERTRLRYGDWVVTCPLLLYELQEMAGVPARARGWPLAGVVAMVGVGYAAVRNAGAARHALFGLSSAVLAAVVHATLSAARADARRLVGAFFALWAAYPVAFLVGNDAAYDVLDAVSKGVFGLYVAEGGAAPLPTPP